MQTFQPREARICETPEEKSELLQYAIKSGVPIDDTTSLDESFDDYPVLLWLDSVKQLMSAEARGPEYRAITRSQFLSKCDAYQLSGISEQLLEQESDTAITEKLGTLRTWALEGQIKAARGREIDDVLTLLGQIEIEAKRLKAENSELQETRDKYKEWLDNANARINYGFGQ